ncbi:TlpA disulfide reductase family protein [Streptosporangium sp. NPDC002524]|uniref:TlpA disulfide reductase family protein n=1 Tax=Streptosporangium sp. NPDC002524 TaxID=3154537 RepID=UPI00332CB7A6
MEIYTAFTILSAVLIALNTFFTLGVARKLEMHSKLLREIATHGNRASKSLQAGDKVRGFSISTPDGRKLESDNLQDETIIAFFSPKCPPCVEAVPELVDYVKKTQKERTSVISVLIGSSPLEGKEMAGQLSPFSDVISGPNSKEIADAFEVDSMPAIFTVNGSGFVKVAARSAADLPVTA